MSIIQTGSIQGPESTDYEITMPAGAHINLSGTLSVGSTGQISFPKGTTAERPASPTAGMARINTSTSKFEYYNGSSWLTFPKTLDGSSANSAAPSAAYLFNNGVVTSGSGFYWIDTANAGPQQVWCDFDTLDADGLSGWMLVAAFEQGFRWGGDGQNISTTSNQIGPTSSGSYPVSSNFGDQLISKFRVTASSNIETDLGTNAVADWYYNWNTEIEWKKVWSPAAGVTQHYLSNGSNPNVQRTSLRKFDNSYNLKWQYNNPEHKYNNITDYGYQNSRVDTADYSYGSVGGNSAPAAGFFDVWTALTTPNNQFEWFHVGRSATYTSRSSGDADGTLAIPVDGSATDTTGQDVDQNVSAKVGNDDGGDWGGAATSATSASGNNGAITNTPLWWWIK